MKYRIYHKISYKYENEVFLEPSRIYLVPRSDGHHHLLSSKIEINPKPTVQTHNLDLYGNDCLEVTFEEKSSSLEIVSESYVETKKESPFDYFLDAKCAQLPVSYYTEHKNLLGGYLSSEHTDIVRNYANSKLNSDKDTIAFLVKLCSDLHAEYQVINRPEGDAWDPIKTMDELKGSCRDLTNLFIACTRSQGIASRFVSGYYEADSSEENKDLHAWAEVYLEGAGWRGFDPSCGLAVQDRHIALASAPSATEVIPFIGSYRGTGVQSSINYEVLMREVTECQTQN